MNWFARLFSRKQLDHELAEELQAHLDEKVEEFIADGLSREEAVRAACLEFGNVGVIEEHCREVWSWPSVEDLWFDVRYGLRALRRSPVSTVVALLTVAIGIAANAAVFTVVNSVLLKPLNYPNADELVSLHQAAPGAEGLADFENGLLLSPSMYFTYSDHNRTFQSLGVWIADEANVTGIGQPQQVRTVSVSDGLFETLGVPPALGRWLSPADQVPNSAGRVVLSYGYWQRQFGGDPTVIGRNITVDSQPREIVGVMAKGFRFVDADFDLAAPLKFDRGTTILAGFGFHGIARLKPDATIAQADADIARMIPIWMDSWSNGPQSNPHIYETWKITPMIQPLKQHVIGNVSELLWVVMGTIGVVMLIACANVTNLLLVRIEARQQELAIRTALGAGRARIVRGLLVESVMLGVIGGVLGAGLAYAGVRFLVAFGPSNLPRLNEIAIDARALAFTFILSVLSGVLFGLIPSLKYAGKRAAPALIRSGRTISVGRDRLRARNLLVVGQVAMALVLLMSAGLMIRTFSALRHVDPGFADSQHLQTMRISIPESLIADSERVTRTQNEILDKLSAIPGVKSAAFVSEMPMEGFDSDWDQIYAEDKVYANNTIPPLRLYKHVSPGLLRTAGTRLIAGREMTWNELYDYRPVVMISESLARELWGSPSAAVGKHLRKVPMMPWCEIVGVIQDVRERGVQEAAPEIVYWPTLMKNPFVPGLINTQRTVTFVVHSDRAGSESLLNEMRAAVWSVNSNLPVASVRTMQEVYDKSVAQTSFTLVMLGIAGTMALALGIIGIYGVMSYTVSQRKREIGIRLALGAQVSDVLQIVLKQGTKLVVLGVVIGACAAFLMTRLMANLLFGVTAHDPLTFVAVGSLLILVALMACYIPARRATQVDPIVALRYE